MKLAAIGSLALASCAAAPSTTFQEQPSEIHSNHVSLYGGKRSLDDGDYRPVDEQITLGVEFAHEQPHSVVGWEIGIMGSADDANISGFDVEGSTSEIYGGVRKTFGTAGVRPYVGAGVSFISAEIEVAGVGSDDDGSIAGYAHAGFSIELTSALLVGLDLRALLLSDMELAGVETDADYLQLALVVSFGF